MADRLAELCDGAPVKIYAWNINSVRARKDRLVEWLTSRQPDVVCLQELKCTDAEFPTDEVRAAGYQAAVFGQKTYNGVAILTRLDRPELEPRDVARGLDDGVEDDHARLISATVGGVRVFSVYAPNGQAVDSPQYPYKLEWYARLRRLLDRRHTPQDAVVLCGDWNVAPEDLDTHDPVLWSGQTLCSLPERKALQDLRGFGLVDTFRALHPADNRFSWWDYRQLAFPKNRGLRIDHVLATPALAGRCRAADIDREARKGKLPSDHAPVWAEFDAG